jgi:hypothetical protein
MRLPCCGRPTAALPGDREAIRLRSSRARLFHGQERQRTMSNPERPFGWRKRIGLLSPTVIETAAYDFYRLAPAGVSMCATTSNIRPKRPARFPLSLGQVSAAEPLCFAGFLVSPPM